MCCSVGSRAVAVMIVILIVSLYHKELLSYISDWSLCLKNSQRYWQIGRQKQTSSS